MAAQKTDGRPCEAIDVPSFDLDRTVLPPGLSSTGDGIFGHINQHCRFYQALYSLPGQHRRRLRLLCKLIGFYGMCGDQSSCKMQVGRIDGLDDWTLAQGIVWPQQCVIDVPGVDTARHQLQDSLNQLALDGVELLVRDALPTVTQMDRQEIAVLNLVSDPAAGLANQLGVIGHRQVVGCLEYLQQLQALALHL